MSSYDQILNDILNLNRSESATYIVACSPEIYNEIVEDMACGRELVEDRASLVFEELQTYHILVGNINFRPTLSEGYTITPVA